ncbi:MAG: winged helix DNA-binding domain-containing protein [Solirubrobacteraceae bacterium]
MLLAREDVSVVAAVERLAGLQAQEPRPPFIGLWTRVEGFTPDALVDALRSGEVVRGLLMRATLHVVSARDFRAFRPAVQPVLSAAFAGVNKRIRGGGDVDDNVPVARELLEESPRTINELRALLSERFPDANHRGLGYAARTHLPLTMVPTGDRWGFPRDAQFAVAECDEDTGPDALVRRYLAAFGPASAADVQTWSGLKGAADVLEGMEDLERFSVGRRTLFDLTDAPRPDGDAPAPVRLLPEFDNLVLAHADRSRLLDDEHRPLVVTKNLRVKATFLVDGRVAGVWKVARSGRRAVLTLEPLKRLRKAATKELETEAEALLRFVEPDAERYEVRS